MRWFVWIARAEGLSLIALFFVAMPLKYGAGILEPVKYVGWIHGLLFILYVAALLSVSVLERWSLTRTAAGFVASVLPFGTFVFERQIVR